MATEGSTTTEDDGTTTTAGDIVDADEEVDEPEWGQNAAVYRGSNGTRVAFHCPPNTTGGSFSVWGTGTYTDDSSVCMAAVHAGLITEEEGDRVVIEIGPGQDAYTGSEANGVTSSDYGTWGGSYTFPVS